MTALVVLHERVAKPLLAASQASHWPCQAQPSHPTPVYLPTTPGRRAGSPHPARNPGIGIDNLFFIFPNKILVSAPAAHDYFDCPQHNIQIKQR
jgi:hypothetical protein